MSQSAFNADDLINRARPVGAMSTAPMAVPADDYLMLVKDLKARQTNDGSVVLDIIFKIDNADLEAKMGRKEVTTRMSCWLDFDASGALSEEDGKNYRLGQLRDAVGQNVGGNWSPSMLIGQVCMGHVGQKTGSDGVTRDQVDRVWART